MTMRKRLPALVLSLLLVLALCACGESKVDYPALDAPDLDTMTLSEVANGSVRAKYDASEWLADPSIDPLTFYYLADTSDEENMVNINVDFLLSGVKRHGGRYERHARRVGRGVFQRADHSGEENVLARWQHGHLHGGHDAVHGQDD